MGSPKCAWRRVAVCAMASMWLAGCANNETSAPISSVGGGNDAGGYSGNAATVESAPQLGQPRAAAAVSGGAQSQVNVSPQGNIVYNRSYDNIQKGSYSGATYQVKRGDTLFYIAWITGNDYRDLAQRNNIPEPYSLNVGQTLQVGNGTTPITGNAPAGTVLASNANQANTGVVVAPVPTANTPLTESSVDSNKNNGYSESSSKQSVGKMLPSSNGKMLPTAGTVATTTAPVAAPSTAPAATASGSTAITGWRWPTDGKIIDNFSAAEGGNKGVDISGSRGQPILATANGRVVYAGNALRGYGNLIIIKHNDDYLSAYAHNDTMLVREQQEVRAGQKIATMGSTGTSTTRLHFEIRYKGKSVNPLRYLPQR
ncbi:Outer membrane lipoprotein [Sodalis praecaptivus]|uniref:Outer membrane lipoprotein n=1 Tax=Sodalis praecaptivus TaxID=1239307 RepID=W0I185_9GAMM|nr:murein hydrolase activator NlpD [Sodalis praecaptivus]AHF78235.1 Outer membrane lipoprotein [Sodalis praecaptivus]